MSKCCHHWYFPTSNGVTSKGTCRKCGATQEAKNYFDMGCDNKYAFGYHRENKKRFKGSQPVDMPL